MFHDEFYPTPLEVAKKMWMKARARGKRVLEPSCGKGDLVELLIRGDFEIPIEFLSEAEKRIANYYEQDSLDQKPEVVFGIEFSDDLYELCKTKGIKMLGHDFLNTDLDHNIELIYMNPPFSNGDEHLLKAWNVVADGGEVVCLLNEETIKNPFSEKRKLLQRIIEDHGNVEYLGDCFSTAERKTNVQVAMVYLKKPENKFKFDFKETFIVNSEKENVLNVGNKDVTSYVTSIAKSDYLQSLEDAYNRTKDSYIEMIKHIRKANDLFKTFSSYSGDRLDFNLLSLLNRPEDEYKAMAEVLKSRAWNLIIEKSNIKKYATSKVRDMIFNFSQQQSEVAFSKKNVIDLLSMLAINSQSIFKQAVVDVFDKLTAYDKENRIHTEGWLTNDSYKINYKVIIPGVFDYNTIYSAECHRWSINRTSLLYDLEIAMQYVLQEEMGEHEICLSKSLEKVKNGVYEGETRYFKWKAHKKGTLHLWFKEEDAWTMFNIIAASGKNWLPANNVKAKFAEEQRLRKPKQYGKAYWVTEAENIAKAEKLKKDCAFDFHNWNKNAELFIEWCLEAGFIMDKKSQYRNEIFICKDDLKVEVLDNTFELLLRTSDSNVKIETAVNGVRVKPEQLKLVVLQELNQL